MNFYILHISFYDLISVGTLFTGLTLALLLGFAKRLDHTANLFLSAALLVITWKTGGLTTLLLPALGPLLYFYIRQLTAPGHRLRQKDGLHFTLVLVGYWMPGWLVLTSVVVYVYLSQQLIVGFYSRLRPVLMDRPRYAFRWLEKVCLSSAYVACYRLSILFFT
ncbi:hypothetical protein [Mucilaginibacter paludis]|uniref:hypothetical protein n=1 Tax=Mucilaginibacter paludis TaxID=423351 RepID=UPI0002555B92|nr:hypothetical protein [Mucilaginibacter paludis]